MEINKEWLDIISSRYNYMSIWEAQRYLDEDVLQWTIQTLCDVRRELERVFWEWIFWTNQILNWISDVRWTFFPRYNDWPWDMCLVSIDDLVDYFRGKILNNN